MEQGKQGILYVVATPIGNLNDLTPRIRQAFEEADFIAAEDTRVTVKLLNHFDIRKPMVSYYAHNLRDKGDEIIDRIIAGETCAVCSDAGTPCVSDPGEILVKQAHRRGIKVVPIPGPSAVITALCVSGQDTGRFCFEGFLSVVKKQRARHLEEVRYEKRTMIFYEAPHKLSATLKDMNKTFGNREVAIVREITKIHEQVIKTTLDEAVRLYGDGSLKGEIVIIVKGKEDDTEEASTLADAIDIAKASVQSGMSVSEAAKHAAKLTGFKKGEIYKALL